LREPISNETKEAVARLLAGTRHPAVNFNSLFLMCTNRASSSKRKRKIFAGFCSQRTGRRDRPLFFSRARQNSPHTHPSTVFLRGRKEFLATAKFINTVYPVLGLYRKSVHHCKYMSKSVYSKDYKDIIKRLKTTRIEAGLSQQEVADKFGKPQSFVSKIESGERRLDVAEIKKFAVIYKKDISFFIK